MSEPVIRDEPSPLFSVVALITNEEGRFLAVSRKDNPEDFGLPGGKIEPGEQPSRAMRREVREETGVIVLQASPIFEHADTGAPGGKLCRCYYVGHWTGEAASLEGAAVRWVGLEVLLRPTASFHAYNLALAEHLLRQGLRAL